MFGIGLMELLVIAVVALVFIGPSRLPQVARQFGRFFVQVRRMTTDVRRTIDSAIQEAEHEVLEEERQKLEEIKKDLRETQAKVEGEARDILTPDNSEPSE